MGTTTRRDGDQEQRQQQQLQSQLFSSSGRGPKTKAPMKKDLQVIMRRWQGPKRGSEEVVVLSLDQVKLNKSPDQSALSEC